MTGAVNRTEPVTAKMAADIVVIGSGPGGAVTATLCAEAGKSVLLVEEGQNLPLHSAAHFSQAEILQKYRNAGVNVALGPTKLSYVEGCCVGGGSEINRGIYHRTPDYILDEWRTEYKVNDLSPGGLTPHFAACEMTARVEYLPGDAPLMSRRLYDGASNLGWLAIEAPRLYRYGSPGTPGHKQSMSETFVPRFLKAGGRLITETFVNRIAQSAGRWRAFARHTSGNGRPQADRNFCRQDVCRLWRSPDTSASSSFGSDQKYR